MKTSWGGVSGWYDELLEKREGTYQKDVILPNLMRMIGVGSGASALKGANVLDLACGQGFFARELAKAGGSKAGESPAKVFGADIAKELIEIAKANPDAVTRKIEYHVAPSNSLAFIADKSIDVITIVLALQNIEDLAGTMQECARILKPMTIMPDGTSSGGRLFIVLNHPAFRIPKRSSWQWDHVSEPGKGAPGAGHQYRRIDAYMSESRERIDMNPGTAADGDRATSKKFTVSFHRPLQVYFKALTKAGFNVARLEEWVSHKNSVAGPRADEENRIRKEIPMFLTLEARRVLKEWEVKEVGVAAKK